MIRHRDLDYRIKAKLSASSKVKKNQNPFFLTLFSFIKVTKNIMSGCHDALNICGAPELSSDFTTYTMGKIF